MEPSILFQRGCANLMNSFLLISAVLAWFKARGTGWQNEINGVLEFYIDTIEHPASEPEPQTPSARNLEGIDHPLLAIGSEKNAPGKRAWLLSFHRYARKSSRL